MHKRVRFGVRLAVTAVCGALLLPGFSTAALAGFSGGRMLIVTEPEEQSSLVTYYKDGQAQDKAGMTWVDGRNGKALLLDGLSEYLQIGYAQLKTNRFSFSAWINWKGAPGGAPGAPSGASEGAPDARYNQRLFTYARRQERWLSVSPFARDASKVKDGGYLNGVYLEFNFNAGKDKPATRLEQFNPAKGAVSYGLPENEWHHLAVVSDEKTMKLYVDGTLWFEDILMMSMVELQALTMRVGAGLGDSGYLHAALDDVALYETALSADQVRMMAGGADPFEEGAAMPPSQAPYLPTRPATAATTAAPVTVPRREGGTIFGLPVVTVALVGGVLVVVAGLSVFLSLRQPSGKKGGGRS